MLLRKKFGAIQKEINQKIKKMDYTFYMLDGAYKENAITIQSEVSYNTIKIFNGSNSEKIISNFRIEDGNELNDIVQFADSSNFAISEKLKSILEINQITGWSCFPIKINGINEKYYAFQNLSKAGKILNLDEINNYTTKHRIFDLKTWDGSDIFNLDNTLINVISSKVKEILELSKITNAEIVPL
jgi:hypothetical protein